MVSWFNDRKKAYRREQIRFRHVSAVLTVPWMDRVWLMWTATKSSNRDRAPGAKDDGDLQGFVIRHLTALM